MTPCDELWVRVNDELVLDAGTCEEVSGPRGPERLIRSPKTTLSQQVLAYLRAKPDPPRRPSGSMVGREGVAATALALRWGSYLAVLLDRDKPVWPEVRSASTSRISDEEMARINIEASAALATWIDFYPPRSSTVISRLVASLLLEHVEADSKHKGPSGLRPGRDVVAANPSPEPAADPARTARA